jgi:hypothetical protein
MISIQILTHTVTYSSEIAYCLKEEGREKRKKKREERREKRISDKGERIKTEEEK